MELQKWIVLNTAILFSEIHVDSCNVFPKRDAGFL